MLKFTHLSISPESTGPNSIYILLHLAQRALRPWPKYCPSSTFFSIFNSVYRRANTTLGQQYLEELDIRLIADLERQLWTWLTHHCNSAACPIGSSVPITSRRCLRHWLRYHVQCLFRRDFRAAFDSALWDRVLHMVTEVGVPMNVLNLNRWNSTLEQKNYRKRCGWISPLNRDKWVDLEVQLMSVLILHLTEGLSKSNKKA